MTSGISSSKWVVFKSAVKRFKWLGILYAVALFLELPLVLWMALSKQKAIQGNLWAEVASKSLQPHILFHPVAHLTSIAVAVIFGLILFYYLQNDWASTFFHSLPIKRWSLYWQNLLAGLTLIWLPILINGLLLYGVMAVFGVTEVQWPKQYAYDPAMEMVNANLTNAVPVGKLVAFWLFLNLLMTGLFYIFTVFVGMLTGNVLLQGALTFIGLILPLGLYLLIKFNLWKLLYGFPRDIDESTVLWLSPLVRYLDYQSYQLLFKSQAGYIWYGVAAVLFCLISLFLYRKRHVEAAGETLAAGWIRRVFIYGVATCATLTGGLYFSTLNESSTGALYLGYFIGGVLGYSIADMIAYKSFHFYRRWKGMVVFGAVFIVLLASVKLDLYGYQKYVPEQDEVKEVFFNGLNRDSVPAVESLKGQDNIRRVRELHRQIIKLEKENRNLEKSLNRPIPDGAFRPEEPRRVMTADITYVLDSGRKVKRTYMIDMDRYREFLYPIFNSEETKRSIYGRLFKTDVKKIDELNISNYHLGKSVRIYKRAEIDEALAALKKDVLNVSYEAAVENKRPTLAMFEFIAKTSWESKYVYYTLNYYEDFKNFTAFLEKHGYMEELFLNPEDVSEIIVKKAGSAETVAVKDKQKIKVLLNWCNLEDERAYLMRQQQPVNKGMVEYYGKIVTKKGSPIFVVFDSSPYAQQLIFKMMQEK
ncbi:DUF6449 domain-containing protein [Carboxydocella sp. JDF658]|uniref:DUF6449 domain-containing protein n=1 Tax=Carboxydocella sp. JDF658 TaxID=1926600 RepID=UPI0009AF0F32|nr:DUF6449 domain-containing protein [Carboxydocella sp. JDF658]GAW30657.1 hypothetical protein JDF658_04220 [Carboxydocella sp. JDF658]